MPIDYGPAPQDVSPAYSLEALQDIDSRSRIIEQEPDIEPIRREALIQASLETGAQGGLLSRSIEINKFLEDNKNSLDRQFPFYPLLIDGEILPPVILESRQALTSSNDGKTLRTADATYKIKSDARFVTAAPTWRDYLFMPQQGITLPHRSVAPSTKAERKLWYSLVTQGWETGVKQADQIYDLALNELQQDYLGMVTYKALLVQGKVSKPIIERNNLGVTGNGREMAVGDRVKQITEDSSLQVDKSYEWKAPVLPDDKPAIISRGQPIEDMQIEVAKTNKMVGAQGVRDSLDGWVVAWESGNTENYLTFYGKDFMVPNGLSRNQWEESRKASIGRASAIDVDMRNVSIIVNDNYQSASISFDQYYTFGSSRGFVEKVILMEFNEQGQWKIAYEAEMGQRKAVK